MSSTAVPKVVPAHLAFLAIYNPALGSSDETFHRQVVFYYARAAARTRAKPGREQELREQENEKLRQVGLAQGLVGFAKSFSNGATVDSVETHKSRIVLHELEPGWWILASVALTQLPPVSGAAPDAPAEHSSREVSPPALLVQQLVRAHAVFALHHGATLEHMLARHRRTKFCSILDTYWARFAAAWDVLLHGSPAVDIYRGMKLAAGGELGMGVGEEEWGSSERDVLEDFAHRTEGLVHVMVSRFGHASTAQAAHSAADPKPLHAADPPTPWLASGKNIDAADGVVFSGLGAVSRKSLRDVSHWVESIYTHGEHAYGVRGNPTADRRKRRKRKPKAEADTLASTTPDAVHQSNSTSALPHGIPPPIVRAVESSLDKASAAAVTAKTRDQILPRDEPKPFLASLGDTETWVKYMTLGYGTAWGGKEGSEAAQSTAPSTDSVLVTAPSPQPLRYVEPEPDVDVVAERAQLQIQREDGGYFLIGLEGDVGDVNVDDENGNGNWNNRILLRTLHVEVDRTSNSLKIPSGEDSDETPQYEEDRELASATTEKLSRLRPVVYVHRPFIYLFLFHQRTDSLGIASFYRDIHNFFSPLHRSLDKSTSPEKVAARLAAASNPHTTISSTSGSGPNIQPIYDLVYDPRTLTIHSSLPNIPDLGTLIAEGLGSHSSNALGWSRVEALNVHSQVLATVASTRRNLSEIERTCKTSRGWWVVWMRLPPSHASEEAVQSQNSKQSSIQFNTDELREAFLVRRARDATALTSKSSGSRFASGMWSGLGMGTGVQSQRMGGAAAGWGPKGLAEGIGIDARRYVEQLLSLNR